MDDDNHPDRLLNEPHELPHQPHERTGSLSLGPNGNDDGASPINEKMMNSTSALGLVDPNIKAVDEVINSEIGVNTLLDRLKQTLASAKEFAFFLQKRGKLEEEHASGLKKLCRTTADSIRRPGHKHGSFLASYESLNSIHERMAEAGEQFAASLHVMHNDLIELAANVERGRKQYKSSGLAAETRWLDAESAMKKAKHKYDSLADDYDRARTGDGQSGKKFGLKGPKSAQQQEADLLRKLQTADSDYAAKVQAAQSTRSELLATHRPDTIKNLLSLIKECDAGLVMQMQKFASFSEKLLMSHGSSVSPMNGANEPQGRSLNGVISAINNENDLNKYLGTFASKIGPRTPEIKYERHPVLNPAGQGAPTPQRQADPPASFGSRQGPPPANFAALQQPPAPAHQSHANQAYNQSPISATQQQHERSFSQGAPPQQYGSMSGQPRAPGGPSAANYKSGSFGSSAGPPQLSTLPFQTSSTNPSTNYPPQQQQPNLPNFGQPQSSFAQEPSMGNQNSYTQSPTVASGGVPNTRSAGNLPPVRPVFGLSLDQLFERDQSAVPMVVYQCIQGVDLFGLELEGIYRLSGTASHIQKLKELFDNDATQVDFRNPENFFHDVNSVAGLLKQFFRDLPDPLLTTEHYAAFIEAAKQEDDIVRRDSLHAIINGLPDPNYATLRAVTLHLKRVVEASSTNRMGEANLGIIFGPTLMGTGSGASINDSGWQVKCVETILANTYQIFDDD